MEPELDYATFYDAAYRSDHEAGMRSMRWRALSAEGKADHIVDLTRRAGLEHAAVLEVGCGDGAVLSELAARGFGERRCGIELSEPAAAIARDRPGIDEVVFSTADRLPHPDGAFDLGILTHVLEHVPDPVALLAETARVCRAVVVEVPLEANVSARRDSKRAGARDVGHVQRFDRAAVRHVVAGAGLEVAAECSDPLPAAVHLFYADSRGARARARARRPCGAWCSPWRRRSPIGSSRSTTRAPAFRPAAPPRRFTAVTRLSTYLLPTEREPPSDAEALSHKLMVRAGLIRQVGAGLWSYLPAGWRSARADGRRSSARSWTPSARHEMLMPVLLPAELWKRSGRYGIDELFKLEDRKGAPMVLAMTHEEVVTTHVAQVVRSYRDLPLILYHFQTKERDEPRPRAGVLRTREFIMKDSYTFDRDAEGLQVGYDAHIAAYDRIFERCGLEWYRVDSDVGMMGGSGRARVHGALRGGRERGRAGTRVRGERRGGQRRGPAGRPAGGRRAARAGLDAGAHDGRDRSPGRSASPGPPCSRPSRSWSRAAA